MKSYICVRVLLTLLVVVFVGGCSSAVPNNREEHRPAPVLVKTTPADVWDALAQAVEQRDRPTIRTPRALAQYVKALSANGELTADDVTRFNGVFHDAPNDTRSLDPVADAEALRRLK